MEEQVCEDKTAPLVRERRSAVWGEVVGEESWERREESEESRRIGDISSAIILKALVVTGDGVQVEEGLALFHFGRITRFWGETTTTTKNRD